MEFPEGNASYWLCSARSTVAGIDVLYRHASAAPSETPLGAEIFSRVLFGSCHSCVTVVSSRIFPVPRAGAWGPHSCLMEWVLGGSSTLRMRRFMWKTGLEIEEGGWSRGGQEALVWSWNVLGSICPAVLPCVSRRRKEKCPSRRGSFTFLPTAGEAEEKLG